MAVNPSEFNGSEVVGPHSTQLPRGAIAHMQALAQAGQGQAVFYDTAGNVALSDGTDPAVLCAGFVEAKRVPETPTTLAGVAGVRLDRGFRSGFPASAEAGDSFTQADQCVPVYDAGSGTPAKKAVSLAGAARPLIGLAFGVDNAGHPIVWAGPLAAKLAAAVAAAASATLASAHITDALAATVTAEQPIPHLQLAGTISKIVFNGLAITGDNTDYAIMTVRKRDSAGLNPVVLGTYDTRLTGQGSVTAFVDTPLVLSVTPADLVLLATDIVTLEITKGGAGQLVIGSFLATGATH